MKQFISICQKDQEALKKYVSKKLRSAGYEVTTGDGYVYAKGNIPILLTAHLDTVHKENPLNIVIKDGTISSPQGIGGDDRCGVYIILKILATTELRPYVLFCEDEEIGGVGSNKFTNTIHVKELANLKYFIELDRHGSKDAVFYNCGNEDFKSFIEKHTNHREAWGSFSDISHLSPPTDVASVNLSVGYYNAHTIQEYVVFSEMNATRDTVIKLLKMNMDDVPEFGYQEDYGYGYEYGYGGGYGGGGKCTKTLNGTSDMWVFNFKRMQDYVFADDFYEALGRFMVNNPDVCFNEVEDWENI